MGIFSDVKEHDISTLKFNTLWLSHPDTLDIGVTRSSHAYPCNSALYANQCAVRMSRSVIKAGVDFSDYPDPTCRGEGDYNGLNYARGAESLANYFYVKFGKRLRKVFIINRQSSSSKSTKKQLLNRKGIIFFRNISGFRGGIGDHIDLWDGKQTTGGEYFDQSTEIWFWELKK